MPLWDINDLIIGLSYKNRQMWEMVRTLGYLSVAPHCKKIDKNKLLSFPWDDEDKAERQSISSADIERMKRLAKKFEKGD